jgi:hypothetical protein
MTPEDATPGTPDAPPTPAIEIVGEASPEQVAALLGVLSAVGDGGQDAAPTRRSGWAAYQAGMRRPLHPGPGAWRSSLRRR